MESIVQPDQTKRAWLVNEEMKSGNKTNSHQVVKLDINLIKEYCEEHTGPRYVDSDGIGV